MTILADSHSHGREPWLAVFGLGGTVASAAGADGGAVPSREIGELLEDSGCIPPGVRVVGTQFRMVASSELTLADIVELSNAIRDAQTAGARGVVVAQGTDTIEETAFALDVLLHDVTIPVVVTGAMRHPSLPGSDAAANLAAALDVATSTAAKNHRVLVVINDEIHTALFVRKAHTTSPSAFSSWPVGAVGWVSERRVHLPLALHIPAVTLSVASSLQIPSVALVSVGLGDDGETLRSVATRSVAGCVVEAMGGGHVPSALVADLGDLASRLPVVISSRTGAGAVLESTYGFAGSETDVLARGVISAGFLTTSKARVFLQLLLAAGLSRSEISHHFASLLRVTQTHTEQQEGTP